MPLLRPLLSIFSFIACSLAASDDNALSIGNSGWGWALVLTHPPRECAPMQLWYNLTHVADPPDWVSLPNDGAVEFRTPETVEDIWMVLRPTMGEGILSWRVPLRTGKQFVVRNNQGYEQVITVGSPTDATSCGQDSQELVSTSQYGELHSAVFNRLRTTNYPAYSVSSGGFRSKDFPSSGAAVRPVTLGPVIPSSSVPDTTPSDPPNNGGGGTSNPPNGGTTDPPNGGTTDPVEGGTTAPADGNTTPSTESTTSGGSSPTTPIGAHASPGGDDPSVDPSHSTLSGQDPGGTSSPSPHGNDNDPNGRGTSPEDNTAAGMNIGAVVGGIVGALLLGLLVGGLCVWFHRRRRSHRQQHIPTMVTNTPAIEETASIAAATNPPSTSRERKDPLLFTQLGSRPASSSPSSGSIEPSSSMALLSPVTELSDRTFFGGVSDFPGTSSEAGTDSTDLRRSNLPPPTYSRFG